MSTTSDGRTAEAKVAEALLAQGLRIVAQNWRTRWCEIDIVASTGKTVYFVEVKYRTTAAWGDGIDAITAKKQQQMQFAAEFWVASEHWSGDVRLAVASLSGRPPKLDHFLLLD